MGGDTNWKGVLSTRGPRTARSNDGTLKEFCSLVPLRKREGLVFLGSSRCMNIAITVVPDIQVFVEDMYGRSVRGMGPEFNRVFRWDLICLKRHKASVLYVLVPF